MASLFVPAEREDAVQAVIDLLGVPAPDGAAADVASFIGTLLPDASTPESTITDVSQVLIMLIIRDRLVQQTLDLIVQDETTLG